MTDVQAKSGTRKKRWRRSVLTDAEAKDLPYRRPVIYHRDENLEIGAPLPTRSGNVSELTEDEKRFTKLMADYLKSLFSGSLRLWEL